MLSMMKYSKIITATILLFYNIAVANSETKPIGQSKAWKAYTSVKGKSKICFIASEPQKFQGNYKRDNRGKTYVFVTNVKNKSNHEVSVVAGYNFKIDSEVFFDIDGNKTKMFPVEDRAWSESSKIDRNLVKKMKRGRVLTVKGVSTPGNKIIDTYSLNGFTKALSLIDKSCK